MPDKKEEMQENAEYWIDAIEKAGKLQVDWEETVSKIYKEYRAENKQSSEEGNDRKRMAIYWSNIETLKPALYSKMPKPMVSRRFKERDMISLKASLILERSIEYHQDAYAMANIYERAREDYLMPGRCVTWISYKPTFGDARRRKVMLSPGQDGGYLDDNGDAYSGEVEESNGVSYGFGEEYQPLEWEQIKVEQLHYNDFRHGPGRSWSEVPWAARRAYMTRAEVSERFGKEVAANLSYKTCSDDSEDEKFYTEGKAQIWEIWCKTKKSVIWVSPEQDQSILEEGPPPLNLRNFFPCPPPLISNQTNNSLIPVTDYEQYKDQLDEIDDLTDRIDLLTSAVRVAGVYAGDSVDIQNMVRNSTENELIPVDNWAAFAEKGGVRGMIDWLPLDQIMMTIQSLRSARMEAKQEMFEITGIADIIRGASNPNETATAQGIKGRFAGMRLSSRQKTFAEYLRDIIEIMVEVMAEQMSIRTLVITSGIQVTDQEAVAIEQLLRNDAMRGFRIDIETDSTLMADEMEEKQARMEYIEVVSKFLERAAVAGSQAPELVEFLGESLMFVIRGFRAGRELEESLERGIQQLAQKAQQPEEPKPDPRLEAEKAKLQMDQQKHQQDLQQGAEEHQQEMQFKQQDHQLQVQLEMQKANAEAQARQQRQMPFLGGRF